MAEICKTCRLSNLAGKPIITLDTGRKLGSVKDIIYDPVTGDLDAITIEINGFFSPRRWFILLESIESLGEDAVMVKSGQVLKLPDSVTRERQIVQDGVPLMGKNVMTEDGTLLGGISDVIIDPGTGKAVKYEVSGGAIRDVQAGRRSFPAPKAMVMGPDALIVPNSVEQELEAEAPGGIAGAYTETATGATDLGNRAARWWNRITRRAQTATMEREEAYVVGKKTDKTIRDDDGAIIVRSGTTVTQETAERARRAGKLGELATAVATSQLRSGSKEASEQAQGLLSSLRQRAGAAGTEISERRLTAEQREMATGKVSDTDILDKEGNIVVRKGEIFTPIMLSHLEDEDLLDQIHIKPIMGTERAVGETGAPCIELVVRAEDVHHR